MLKRQTSSRWTRAVVATVALTAAVAVVAMAGRAPLSGSTPVNASSASAPVAALFVLFLGAGVVALGAIAIVAWPARRRKKDDEPEFEPAPLQVHWIWKLLAILLPFALGAVLVAAAVLGAKTVDHAPRPGGSGSLGRPLINRTAPERRSSVFVLPSWLPWTLLAIAVVAIGAGAFLLLRRRVREDDEPSESDAVRAAVEAAIGALDTASDPRSAVIAAYRAMEQTLAGHGVARLPAEAPREYLRRVLLVTSGAERDVSALTGLFEEARFSLHPISEQARSLALAALSALRVRLRTGEAG